MGVHPAGCDCGSYACELRGKGVQVSPAATPTSSNRSTTKPKAHENNSWEKGVAKETRPGGTEMPILRPDGSTIPIKTFVESGADKRHAAGRRERNQNRN